MRLLVPTRARADATYPEPPGPHREGRALEGLQLGAGLRLRIDDLTESGEQLPALCA